MATQETRPAEEETESAPLRKRLRWRRIISAAILLLGIVLWLTPALLARTALRHQIAGYLFPAYTGTAKVGAAALGWTAPIVLRDVTLRDSEGRQWLTIPELRSSQTLATLAFSDTAELGTFTLIDPMLRVRLRAGGSSFEDRLWELLADDGSSESTGVTVAIENGSATWLDTAGREIAGGLQSLDATIHQAADAPWPAPVTISTDITDGEHSGSLRLEIAKFAQGNDAEAKPLAAKIDAETIPLAPLSPWLDRWHIAGSAAGVLTGELTVTASPASILPVVAQGNLHGERLRISAPSGGLPQPILIEDTTLGGTVEHDGDRLRLENVVAHSDAAHVEIDADVDPEELLTQPASWPATIRNLLAQEIDLTGTIDLARLPAAISPLSPSKRSIEAGRLRVMMKTGAEAAVRRGTLRLTTTDLVASLPDRKVTWEAPFSMDLVLEEDESGRIAAERIAADSDFLSLDGAVSLDESLSTGRGNLSFDLDLDTLREKVSQIVPITKAQLAGRATGECRVVPGDEPGLLQLSASARLTDFALAAAGRRWSEPEFHADGTATVRLADRRLQEIEAAQVALRGAEGDAISLKLADEAPPNADALGPFDVTAQGDVSRWLNRLRNWSLLPHNFAWSGAGRLDGTARISLEESRTHIEQLDATIEEFRAGNGSTTINEPKLSVTGAATHDAASEIVTSRNLRLACETVGVVTEKLRLPLAGNESLDFQGTVRGSLSKIARYVLPAGLGVWPTGVIAGNVTLSQEADSSRWKAGLEVDRPSLKQRRIVAKQGKWVTVWSDASATLETSGRYAAADKLTIDSARWKSDGAEVDLSGTIAEASSRALAALEGRFTYDWAALQSHLADFPTRRVTLEGTGSRTFSVQGPLFASNGVIDPALKADAGLGWQKLVLWGLPLEEGRIHARLRDRTLAASSSRVPLAGGTAMVAARLPFAAPLAMRIDNDTRAGNIRLTPAICRSWLSYAAPFLADVTEVDGTLSLQVKNGAIPVLNPAAARGGGLLDIQGATAKPGPSLRSILKVVQQVQQIAGRDPTRGSDLKLAVPKQTVRLRVGDGRVHHDRFQVRMGDADGPVIQTTGSVGFEESLDLVASIPMPWRWFDDERLAKALGGQTLRVPIGGTLSQPVPDSLALQELSRRAAAGAVKNMLNRQIEEQLGDDAENPLKNLLERAR